MGIDPNAGFDISALRQIADSDAGKALIHLLNTKNHDKIQEAISSASAGDMHKAKTIVESILAAPGVKEALSRLGEENGR